MEMGRREAGAGPIRLLFEVGPVAGLSDGELLGRFLDRRSDEEAAEVAFAALVERHGSMVLRACRGRLGDEHDAQDAFQATFLILARKAGTIRDRDSAASWLRGVARKVASCARKASSLRRAKERRAAGAKASHVAEVDRSDLVPAILEEVGDLPETDRAPLMLCLLDGLTHEEAATRLGWPVGTVKTRVRRAKGRLRVRLTRRGLAPSLAAIAAALATPQASAMPAGLARSTARLAMGVGVGRALTHGLVSASVAGLVELGLESLIMTRWKLAGLVVASLGVLAIGAAKGLARPAPQAQEKPKPAEARQPDLKQAVVVPKPDPARLAALESLQADLQQEERLDQIETAQLDIELLQFEVAALKRKVMDAMNSRLMAEDEARALTEPHYPTMRNGGFGGGGVQPLTGQALEDARKQSREYFDYTRKNLEEARTALLAKNHDLKREVRRLEGLTVDLPTPRPMEALRATTKAKQAGEARPAADVESRLSEVERKLDLILKALKK